MNINGSNPDSGTFQSDNFPIGLVTLSNGKQLLTFKLLSINKFAMNLLKISPQSSSLHSDFVNTTKQFKEYFFENGSAVSLYDYLVSAKTIKDESLIKSTSFIFNEEIIMVKIRQTKKELYMTIDSVSDDRLLMRKKLISSIKKNFLITINHELKNLLCGLITTLEESKMLIDSKDYITITATVILIQKIVKLYILFTKVSFDDLREPSLKYKDNIDLNNLFLRMQVKFGEVFLYKNIQKDSFVLLKQLSIKTDYNYIKDLLFVLFFFLYYKTYDNSKITMTTEYFQSSCTFSFSNDNYNQISVTGKDVTFEDEVKMNVNQIKKSVMTPDILEYLLKTICKYLHFDIHLKQDIVSNTIYKNSNKKLLSLTIYNIEIGEEIKQLEHDRINAKTSKFNIIIDPVQNPFNVISSVIDFPFEKKNTYDKTRLKEENNTREFHCTTNKTLKNCSTMSKSENAPSNILCIPNQYEKVIYAIDNDGKKKPNEQEQFKSAHFQNNDHFLFFNSDFESSDIDELSIGHPNSKENNTFISLENGLNIIGAYKNIFGRSKKVNNSLVVNHPFVIEDTIVSTSSISQKVASILANNEVASNIVNQVYLNNNNSLIDQTNECKCNNILIVDDEVSIARSMMKMIQSQNYDSDYCKNGRECIHKMQSKLECDCNKRYYKLILLDVYMPDWDGIATCSKIKELIQSGIISPELNVVFISGHKLKDLLLPEYHFVQGFYQKPVNRATILSILEKYYVSQV